MTGPFTTPILRPADCLNPEQKARGAALLVAAEARPGSTGSPPTSSRGVFCPQKPATRGSCSESPGRRA